MKNNFPNSEPGDGKQQLGTFNLAAFLLPSLWCIQYRQWKLFLLFFAKNAIIFSCVVFTSDYGLAFLALLACTFFHSFYMGGYADSIALKSAKNENFESFIKAKKLLNIEAIIVFPFVAFLYLNIVFPPSGFIRNKPKSEFTACMEQLAHVKTGIESYLTENDSLKGVSVPDDMCEHILPGFDKASQCRGKVRERIDGKETGVCLKGSFSFKTNSGFDYELRAQSRENTQCKICVTEKSITPERYEDCRNMKYDCMH